MPVFLRLLGHAAIVNKCAAHSSSFRRGALLLPDYFGFGGPQMTCIFFSRHHGRQRLGLASHDSLRMVFVDPIRCLLDIGLLSDFWHEESFVFAHDWSTHHQLLVLPSRITGGLEVMNSVARHINASLIVHELLMSVLLHQVQLVDRDFKVTFILQIVFEVRAARADHIFHAQLAQIRLNLSQALQRLSALVYDAASDLQEEVNLVHIKLDVRVSYLTVRLNLRDRPHLLDHLVRQGLLCFDGSCDCLEEALLDAFRWVQTSLLSKVIDDVLEGFLGAVCRHRKLSGVDVSSVHGELDEAFLDAVLSFQVVDILAYLKAIVLLIHGIITNGHIVRFYLDVTIVFESLDLS